MKLITLVFLFFLSFIDSYSQSSESIYLKAIEAKNNQNSNELNTTINLLEKSITIDDNFIEAHFQLAESFMDWELKKSRLKEAKYHYDKAINLLELGIKLKGIDSLTERTIYRNVAFAYDNIYNLNINDSRDYYEKSIELYYKALEYPYNQRDLDNPSSIDFDSDSEFEIKKAIAECYESLARIDKYEKHYIAAISHLYDAKKNISRNKLL